MAELSVTGRKTRLLAGVLALCLLCACTAAPGSSQPETEESSGSGSLSSPVPDTAEPDSSGSEAEPEEEPQTVTATAYLFDQRMILDEMNRQLEQYSQLSPEAERFPERSVEVMRMMGEQFEKMAALTPPEGYEAVVPLAEGAAETMETVTGLVEEAFAQGLDTEAGAARLAEAQEAFSGAVDALEEITALLSRSPEEASGTAADPDSVSSSDGE